MKVLMTKHKKVRGIRKSENQKVICIQFWNVDFDKASTSYFKSSVLGHTMANDIYLNFQETLKEVFLARL